MTNVTKYDAIRNGNAKISAAQKVIKSKFLKAYTNRVNHEKCVNDTMKPLYCRRHTTSKETVNKIDSNKLCNRLQKLIESQSSRKINFKREIEIIIGKLRELEIII